MQEPDRSLALMHSRMLYDFHEKQNAKKTNSIHATYLISGTKRSAEDTNGANGRSGEDVSMRSSPFMSSMPEPEAQEKDEPVKKSSILLVREEELASRFCIPTWGGRADDML